jgi:hypothetical protein
MKTRSSHSDTSEKALRRAMAERDTIHVPRLGISVRTVEVHKAHGMRKTNMHSRLDVVQYALVHGWLQQR